MSDSVWDQKKGHTTVGNINLPILDLDVDADNWDSLIRQFAIENQYEGYFVAKDFVELTATLQTDAPDAALTDSLDLIKFSARKRFADALKKKYRIGSEFADDHDANDIFDKAFITAEAAAMASLEYNHYTFDTLIYIELFYWVTLQVLRLDRGEYVDRKSQGNQVRLGANLDLAGDGFASLSSQFYEED